MTVDKQLLKAVGTLMLLDPLDTSGSLDEVGKGLFADARDVLLSQPPRVLVDAFLTWNSAGRQTFDPRPQVRTITDELASRDRQPGGHGKQPAVLLRGYRGATD